MATTARVDFARPGSIRLPALPPLALYVHIPWCTRKCPYCDFNSHEKSGALPEQEYASALIADLEQALPEIWGRSVYSVFFGGGTPSLFSPRTIDRLLSDFRAQLQLASDAEITLEANPGTFEAAKFRDFRAAGINRLSIGVQSFDDAMLAGLGRVHGSDEARRAIEHALGCFEQVNVDLMYGLPRQSVGGAGKDIAEAVRLGAPHISAYQLSIEPNTVFHSKPPPLPAHDDAADMQESVEALLAGGGYEHYETSAFARPGARCRHNLNYWQFGDYLGIGAGAHGKLSSPGRIERHARAKQPREYMNLASQGASMTERRELGAKDLPFEFMLNALRMVEGFRSELFRERTGLEFAAIRAALDTAEARGLIERDQRSIRPSLRGQRFLNDLLELFLPG
ncbi:MAG: oxygen-independent coproporphyrinogen III oxidase-like protein [Betaproteobacteria bacterium]|nr:oxygen-independent coproporphyrinogen III oxidase-like protein [Betaproteobacteria bacterium]